MDMHNMLTLVGGFINLSIAVYMASSATSFREYSTDDISCNNLSRTRFVACVFKGTMLASGSINFAGAYFRSHQIDFTHLFLDLSKQDFLHLFLFSTFTLAAVLNFFTAIQVDIPCKESAQLLPVHQKTNTPTEKPAGSKEDLGSL